MKNTSILIPIILIACLLALAYLITQAFKDGQVSTTDGADQDRIVLNPEDYREDDDVPADIGTSTQLGDDELDDYFQDASDDATDGRYGADADRYEAGTADRDGDSPAYNTSPAAPATTPSSSNSSTGSSSLATTTDSRPTTTTATGNEGRYLVIAGSFRQLVNAEERVGNLQRAGFTDSRLERFNRGTFAVALAGQSNSFSTANRLAERIRAAGFEARVMRRR